MAACGDVPDAGTQEDEDTGTSTGDELVPCAELTAESCELDREEDMCGIHAVARLGQDAEGLWCKDEYVPVSCVAVASWDGLGICYCDAEGEIYISEGGIVVDVEGYSTCPEGTAACDMFLDDGPAPCQ